MNRTTKELEAEIENLRGFRMRILDDIEFIEKIIHESQSQLEKSQSHLKRINELLLRAKGELREAQI